MKKLATILLCAIALTATAQKRNGNVFVAEKRTAVRDTVVTDYKYEVNGKQYPIIINRKTGTCYIGKVSKNGKWYRQYLNAEIRTAICKEMGIKVK